MINKLSDDDKNTLKEIKYKINTYCRLIDEKENIKEEERRKIDIIQNAINNNNSITIEYYSKGILKTRTILPIQIYVYESIIMVVVHYSADLTDIRHLNLKRIENIII